MTNNRKPIFELHIRPMFRTLDRVHMMRLPPNKRIDLMDYQQVRDSHVKIKQLLSDPSPMPNHATGGPWPQEWIDLFERWTETEFGRLSAATGTNFQLTLIAADRYELSCTVTLPDSSARAWFDILAASPNDQRYQVCVEANPVPNPSPKAVTIEERIRGPLSGSEVVVLDSAGEHKLPVPVPSG